MNCAPLSQEASQEILVLENALMHIHTACSLDVSGGGGCTCCAKSVRVAVGGGGGVGVCCCVSG